ncbi:MAG: hypothetical protein ACXABY_33240 [Candidatus Thorarchaeota archaeon]|jgi:hypothetical protein
MGLLREYFKRQKNHGHLIKANNPNVAPMKVISLDNTPVWEKRGWKQEGNSFRGYYRTQYQACKGEIIRRGDIFEVFICDPPSELRNHSRWICFRETIGKKYRISLSLQPRDMQIDSIILYVERLIYESDLPPLNRSSYCVSIWA